MRKSSLKLLSLFAIISLFMILSPILAQSNAAVATTEETEEEDIDLGYMEGFDFEALGVIGNIWRLGRIYYEESLYTAKVLDETIDAFLANPNEETQKAAQKAWTVSRTPYLRTEVFRFVIPQVADWEGKVNAWPLDEGLLDYTANPQSTEENPIANANLVASAELLVDGQMLDASVINDDILDALSEAGGGEAFEKNVTTGYHAVEFLLWGQDLYGNEQGAGERPWTDFALDADSCTNGNCDRRRALLKVVSERLVSDLEEMVGLWKPGAEITAVILGADSHDFIEAMVMGTAQFLQVELAGERMRLALDLNDPEEEHDCFSDQTHRSHFYNLDGVASIFAGAYHPTEGLPQDMIDRHASQFRPRETTHLLDLYIANEEAHETLEASQDALTKMYQAAQRGQTFDTLIAAGDERGNLIVQSAISELIIFSFALEALSGS